MKTIRDLQTPESTIAVQSVLDTEVAGITDEVIRTMPVTLRYPFIDLAPDLELLPSSWRMLANILTDVPTDFQVVCLKAHQHLGYLAPESIPMFIKLLGLPATSSIGYYKSDKPLTVSDLWAFS